MNKQINKKKNNNKKKQTCLWVFYAHSDVKALSEVKL